MVRDMRLLMRTEYRKMYVGRRCELELASLMGRAGDGVPSRGWWFGSGWHCDTFLKTQGRRTQHGSGYRAHPCPRMWRFLTACTHGPCLPYPLTPHPVFMSAPKWPNSSMVTTLQCKDPSLCSVRFHQDILPKDCETPRIHLKFSSPGRGT